MSTYHIMQLKVFFHAEKSGRKLTCVKYKIFFCINGKQVETFEGVTDQTDGATEFISLEKNGELRIFVEGYKTPQMKKAMMQPLLSSGSYIVKIENNKLKDNAKFYTEDQYNQRKLELQTTLERVKQNRGHRSENIQNNAQLKVESKSVWDKVAKLATVRNHHLDWQNNHSIFEEQLEKLGKNYSEYKANNTKIINSPKMNILYFKSYMVYQFVTSQLKAIPNIRYQVFAKSDTKPLVNNNPSAAGADGMTKLTATHLDNYIQYFIGKNTINSKVFRPVTCVDEPQIQKIVVKTSMATTDPDPNYTVNMASVKNPPIVINPHSNEVLILAPEHYAEFDQKTKLLNKAISNVHRSNHELRKQIQARSIEEIEQLEKNLNLNQKAAISKINGEFSRVADIREVWIVETRANTQNAQPKTEFTRRYLTAQDYEDLNKKRLNTVAKVSITSSSTGLEGKGQTDTIRKVEDLKKINESFKKLSNDLKVTLLKKKIGNNDAKAIYDLIGGLGGEIAQQYNNSHGTDVSYEAQWMRMVAGSGAEGSMSVSNKGQDLKMSVGANASVKWTIFEGVKEWKWFYPSAEGWNLQYQNFDLGIIRFMAGTEVSGSIGANLGIAANLSIDISHKDGKQLISATVRDPGTSLAKAIDKAKKVKLEPANGTLTDTDNNQAKAELKAFAGAQIQGLFKGGVEWYNQYNKNSAGKEEPKFVSIASASAGGGLSAGAGAEGQFRIVYDTKDNKFKIYVAAHLCWGIGAKGIASFEVAGDQLLNYIGFIKSQLAYAGFKALIFIQSTAFKLASQVLAYCLGRNHPLTEIIDSFSVVFDNWIMSLDIDQGRLNTARNINSHLGKQELIYATPETKGILLYAITHWSSSSAAVFDVEYKFDKGEINFFPERKTAVINILKTCLSAAEWKNTIQHIHPQGRKLTIEQMGKVEGDLVRFLNYSPYDDDNAAKEVIEQINHAKNFKTEQNNHWMEDYIKYRNAVKQVNGSLDYMLVRNQDEAGFQQILIAQGLKGGLEQEQLHATNLDVLAPMTTVDQTNYQV
ncbi:hypothetical protein [Acinetobacter rudis]|uniref:hypothetical protein n=1 Tax=Acinetobacter rudis TaxID=632955 RepID=UPI0033412D5D